MVLLRGDEDRHIQDFFIEQAFPGTSACAPSSKSSSAGEQGRSTRELMGTVNLGAGRIDAMLKILDVEGAVRRRGSRWHLIPGNTWSYDSERYAEVTALRRAEQRAMAAYGTDGRCLMRTLQEELDDPEPRDCGRCSVCTSPRFGEPPAPRLVEQAGRHLRSRPLELEVRKMAARRLGDDAQDPDEVRTEPGWALARVGDGGWWPAVERGLRSGVVRPRARGRAAELVRQAKLPLAWVTSVPSASLGDALDRLAGASRPRSGWSTSP